MDKFERECEVQKIKILPESFFIEYQDLLEKYQASINYDGTWDCWEIFDFNDHPDNIEQAVNIARLSIKTENLRIKQWNIKAKLLSTLGEQHQFVQGYLYGDYDDTSNFISKGDGDSCLSSKESYEPRSYANLLNYISVGFLKIWTDGHFTTSKTVSYILGIHAKKTFEYNGKFLSIENVDLNDNRTLSELTKDKLNENL